MNLSVEMVLAALFLNPQILILPVIILLVLILPAIILLVLILLCLILLVLILLEVLIIGFSWRTNFQVQGSKHPTLRVGWIAG